MLEPNQSRPEWVLPETLQMLAEGGDAEAVAEIIEIFKSDTARRLQILRDALTQLDGARVKQQAHAIKGSAVQVGAHSLAALCARIELEGRDVENLVIEAEADFENLCRNPAV